MIVMVESCLIVWRERHLFDDDDEIRNYRLNVELIFFFLFVDKKIFKLFCLQTEKKK